MTFQIQSTRIYELKFKVIQGMFFTPNHFPNFIQRKTYAVTLSDNITTYLSNRWSIPGRYFFISRYRYTQGHRIDCISNIDGVNAAKNLLNIIKILLGKTLGTQ